MAKRRGTPRAISSLLAGAGPAPRHSAGPPHRPAAQFLMQQAHGGRGGRVVVIHHPQVFGAFFERGLRAYRIAVGRAGVLLQRDDAHLAGPAAGELFERCAGGVADHHHAGNLLEGKGLFDQATQVDEAIAVGDRDDGRLALDRHVAGHVGQSQRLLAARLNASLVVHGDGPQLCSGVASGVWYASTLGLRCFFLRAEEGVEDADEAGRLSGTGMSSVGVAIGQNQRRSGGSFCAHAEAPEWPGAATPMVRMNNVCCPSGHTRTSRRLARRRDGPDGQATDWCPGCRWWWRRAALNRWMTRCRRSGSGCGHCRRTARCCPERPVCPRRRSATRRSPWPDRPPARVRNRGRGWPSSTAYRVHRETS